MPAPDRVTHLGGMHCLVNARHGRFLANQSDFYIGNALVKYGEYGESEWRVLSQLAPQGAVVAEIGANIGTHTVPLAKAVGDKGRVIAVEPQRIIHQYLCANVALNSLSNVETHHAGCGAGPGSMVVPHVEYHSSARNNFGGVALLPQGEGESVNIRALDEIVGERKLHLLKVDVEGMEAEVLRGAEKILREHRPFLYIENDRQTKSEALINLIQHFQYRAFWHMPRLFNAENFFDSAENIYGNFVSVNLICVPMESRKDMRNFTEALDAKFHPLRR
jgi:FkbM family methyltransferase